MVKFVKDETFKMWIYELLKTDKYRSWIIGSCTGSTVKHTSPTRIEDYKFILPPIKLIQSFLEKAASLYALVGLNELENVTNSKIRDLLLPRLITGELEL